MRLNDFDFDLPPGAIAERPSSERDRSRLLVVSRDGTLDHRRFSDLPEYLSQGDLLLLNNSKVFPARLTARKPTGGKIDLLLVKRVGPVTWEVLSRSNFTGPVTVGGAVRAELWDESDHTEGDQAGAGRGERPRRFLRFAPGQGVEDREVIEKYGLMPLPPYIRRAPDSSDRERYQTVYAEREGSIAAPTAGLHFTRGLLGALETRGVLVRTLTLHVGVGTFRPITSDTVEDHSMDAEYFDLPTSVLHDIGAVKASGRRVMTVGTTATRAIEAVAVNRYRPCRLEYAPPEDWEADGLNGTIRGWTDLFIRPGHSFKAVDSLITNFHLPRSTPLMLASALCGRERLLGAYNEAITKGYRFFSYGDAMLIL
jgi:S-adenosylmethionine:tRNA ribosyltransferase-isomerase